MTRRTAIARLLVAASVLVALVVGGCSVSTNEEPQAAGNLFSTFLESTTTTTSTTTPADARKTEPLYFLEAGDGATRLKFAERDFELGADVQDILKSLFTVPPDTEGAERPQERGLTSAIPPSAVLVSATPADEEPAELRVEVSGLFGTGGLDGSQLRNALAQIVWTATESAEVDQVSFWADGERKRAITGNGQTVDGPVGRRDYTRLG